MDITSRSKSCSYSLLSSSGSTPTASWCLDFLPFSIPFFWSQAHSKRPLNDTSFPFAISFHLKSLLMQPCISFSTVRKVVFYESRVVTGRVDFFSLFSKEGRVCEAFF